MDHGHGRDNLRGHVMENVAFPEELLKYPSLIECCESVAY